jgi:hypothetical protein
MTLKGWAHPWVMMCGRGAVVASEIEQRQKTFTRQDYGLVPVVQRRVFRGGGHPGSLAAGAGRRRVTPRASGSWRAVVFGLLSW